MITNFSDLQFAGSLASLANYENAEFFFYVAAHNLSAGQVSQWSTTWPLNNSNAISSSMIQYSGIETVWRPVSGAVVVNYPNYQLITLTYYSGGNLQVNTFVVNLTGGLIAIPLIAVNVRTSLYNAPF